MVSLVVDDCAPRVEAIPQNQYPFIVSPKHQGKLSQVTGSDKYPRAPARGIKNQTLTVLDFSMRL